MLIFGHNTIAQIIQIRNETVYAETRHFKNVASFKIHLLLAFIHKNFVIIVKLRKIAKAGSFSHFSQTYIN